MKLLITMANKCLFPMTSFYATSFQGTRILELGKLVCKS